LDVAFSDPAEGGYEKNITSPGEIEEACVASPFWDARIVSNTIHLFKLYVGIESRRAFGRKLSGRLACN
jgi:hypothetical protein